MQVFEEKKRSLENSLSEFKEKVNQLEKDFNISHNVSALLNKCASEVPAQLFTSTAKKVAGAAREKQYHPAIRKFSLTLQLASTKAYRLQNTNYPFIYNL